MKLLAIDGNSIVNRAYYGIKPLSNKDGVPTHAILGFMNIYLKVIKDTKPDAVAVAFDMKTPTFRHKAVETYKANRRVPPDDLIIQMEIIKKLLGYMGVRVIHCEGYEADDILGTLSKKCWSRKWKCYILTGDRDCLQLINDRVTVLLHTNKGIKEYDENNFFKEYEFEPEFMVTLKALMGDSSDNIKGVAGIGEKTAKMLVRKFERIDFLYDRYKLEDYKGEKLSPSVIKKLESGEGDARESEWLVTIDCEAPIEISVTDCIPKERDENNIRKLLQELEMFKLMEKLGIEESPETDFSVGELDETAIESLGESEVVYSFSVSEKVLRVMKSGERTVLETVNPEIIRKFFESPCRKITSDLKKHYRYAMSNGFSLKNPVCDTCICGYLLDSSTRDYSTENLCKIYHTPFYRSSENYAEILSLAELSRVLLEKIKNEGTSELSLFENVEMPLVEVLASMEHYGMCVDREDIENFGKNLSEMIDKVKLEIFEIAGHEFNISSPQQLSHVLFEEMKLPHTKKLPNSSSFSTNAEALDSIYDSSPIIEKILQYRQYTKLNSTYVTGLLEKISPDGRIHTNFNQTETRTGRLSSSGPNMQNIPVRTPLGSQMRKFFTAPEGRILIDADYSQIELRITANISGDKNMINAFESGEDIHVSTASQIFDIPPILVTPEMRSSAKAINFGIIYGMGEFSLSKDVGITVKEAKKYIDDYLGKYEKIREFIQNTVACAEKDGFVKTLFGRKRYIPEIKSKNRNIRSSGERIAVNSVVQGTSADIMKFAMINVYRRLKDEKLDAHLILQVHDELIIESDISCADRCREILKEEMESVCDMAVPLTVDVNTGKSWYDAKG